VPARRLVFDTNGPAVAALLLGSLAAAFVGGLALIGQERLVQHDVPAAPRAAQRQPDAIRDGQEKPLRAVRRLHRFNTFARQSLTDRMDLGVNVANGNLLLHAQDLQVAGTGLDSRSIATTIPRAASPATSAPTGDRQRRRRQSRGLPGRSRLLGAERLHRLLPPERPHHLRHPARSGRRAHQERLELRADLPGLGREAHLLRRRLPAESDADRNGNAISYAYDGSNRLTQITDTQGRPITEPDGDWRELPLIKSRMAGGYCLRTAAQGVCPYTNVCEHCPNYRSEPALLAVLSAQRVDAQALADDARRRGWNDEATRHAALVDRLDAIMAKTSAA
jgi:YD repeat-containing protein